MPNWVKKNKAIIIKGFLYASFLLVFLQACVSSEAEKIFMQGEESWHAGEYRKAVESFLQVVDAYPKDSLADDALFRLGDIHHLFLNRHDEAIIYFQDLINLYPESPKRVEARMKIAAIYRGTKGDCRRAVVEYQEVLNDDPPEETAEEAQYRIAMCYYQNGDIKQAKTEFEILAATYPGGRYTDDALSGIAHSCYALQRYEGAIEVYRKVIEISDDNNLVNDAFFGVAASYAELGSFKKAIETYRRILDDYPNRKVVEERISKLEERMKKSVQER